MGKYFTVDELIYSATAKLKKIDNTPNGAIKRNIESLIEQLDKIRAKYGKPIFINSGYRCDKLNDAVKGVKTSNHLLGVAADLDTRKGKAENQKLYDLIIKNFDFDECHWENNGAWIHYAYVRPNRKKKANITQC